MPTETQITMNPIETEQVPCNDCGEPVEQVILWLNGRRFGEGHGALCESCQDIRQAKHDAEQARRRAQEALERFQAICPPLYRETDEKRIPAPFSREIAEWEYSPQGLGLIGRHGTMKTRSAWLLLKRMHLAGKKIFGCTATEFAKASADQWSDTPAERKCAAELLQNCKKADILLLDDLGKQKFTERAEMELFDLLEYRTSHLLPTIWTANAGKGELKQMLSPDRGGPILRRLIEFSKVLRAEEQPKTADKSK